MQRRVYNVLRRSPHRRKGVKELEMMRIKYFGPGEEVSNPIPVTPPEVKSEEAKENSGPKHEESIPYDRFQEVIKERDALRREKAARDAKEAADKEEAQKKNGEWELLAKQKDAELAAAQEALKTSTLKQAVLIAAVAGNAVDPDAVWALLDKNELKVAEDGTPVGVQEAVAKLLASKQFLIKPANPTYDMGAGGTGGNLTIEEIGKLSPSAYREWRLKHPEA